MAKYSCCPWASSQGGYINATSKKTLFNYPISFPTKALAFYTAYAGKSDNSFSGATGVTSILNDNRSFYSAMWAASSEDRIRWLSIGE